MNTLMSADTLSRSMKDNVMYTRRGGRGCNITKTAIIQKRNWVDRIMKCLTGDAVICEGGIYLYIYIHVQNVDVIHPTVAS